MATPPSPVTVLVVDDHPVVARGLDALLSAEDWVSRVLQAATAREARRLATTEAPDVAVVDLALPDGDGVELVGYLRAAVPACAAVVLSMTHDAGAVRAALDAGARGYLLKETAPDVLLSAVRTVAGGGHALGPGVLLDDRAPGRAGVRSPVDLLTGRERQLLGMLADGLGTAEIAARLVVSEKTVRNQTSILLSRIGVRNRVQAALLAREHGISGSRP